MRLQPSGQLQGGSRLLADSQLQGLQTTSDEKAGERVEHGTSGVLNIVELLVQRGLAGRQGTPQTITMSAQVLGGGMHHDINAMLQRTNQHWSAKGVVDANHRAMLMGDVSQHAQIGNRK